MTPEKQLEIIKRGTIDFISEEEWMARLSDRKKNKLRVKLGVDPTAPDIHLGHTVVLQKLQQFQELGHQAVLIIGDYTALVGDPSGTQKTRPPLTSSDIKRNAETYFDQVKKVLDFKSLEIRHNSEWFKKMSFEEVIRLASRMTVARILERDDFSKRFKGGVPICIHEFIYPLMQGYDSLMVNADVEIGGTDQLFNLLVGRTFQKEEGKAPQIILTTPLLEGTDGVQKMSKSLGNAIGVTDTPQNIYGKIMSISDDMMWKYYELLSQVSVDELQRQKEEVVNGNVNPRDLKMALASEMVERFHSKHHAQEAAGEFQQIFQAKKNPKDLETVVIEHTLPEIPLGKLMVEAGCSNSHSEARRLIQQGAVSMDGERVRDVDVKVKTVGEIVLKVGKRRFKKIKFK